ncbi:carboxypeptidase regulatory-like domain-containing protein [Telmatobacter bradus]|uniref:TonB-dependent receptor n=1 Tax=Telmatobacter bradus TaxID=474953 RepID=UPI003B437A95
MRRSWLEALKLLGCVVVLLSVALAGAQNTASISGTIRDTTGAVIPKAKVVLVNQASQATRSQSSNGSGYFLFAAVQPGTYKVEVSRDSFETWTVTGIEVHPGDALAIPKINLAVASVVVSATVTAEVAGVELTSGAHSTLLTSGDINRLATTGRDTAELISTLPGFTINAGSEIQNQGADYQTMGFGNSRVSSYGANGAAPQQGLVSVVSDGANVIDPGDMGGQISNVNMSQVQEVKVETSAFGADQAKGPIVINAVGKSGGSAYHGDLHTVFRNSALNANDWISNYYGIARAQSRYFYPGASIGGPVLFPGTRFNHNKHLVFWAGYEYYGQVKFEHTSTAFVPPDGTDSSYDIHNMLGGDLSSASIAKALNVDPTLLATDCALDYSVASVLSNVGGLCYSPSSGTDQNGATVNGGVLNTIDSGASAITRFYPKPNRIPKPTAGYLTDGINYVKNVSSTHNGFQFHTRVDENISDSLKLYGTYNWEKVNDESPLNNIYYDPNNTVPFPTSDYSNTGAQYLTLNLTKVLSARATNELTASGVYFNEPEQFGNRSAVQDTGTAWASAGYSGGYMKNGVTQIPRFVNDETVGLPSLAMGYVPANSQYLRKVSWNVADNFTYTYRTHTAKIGAYLERTGNNQLALGSQANGTLSYMRWDTCPTDNATVGSLTTTFLGNEVGNFLIGCPLGYQQDYNKNGSVDPASDMYFYTMEGYLTDEWKVNSRITLTYGVRFSHLTPWSDAHGVGMAVWDPKGQGLAEHQFLSTVTSDPKTWAGFTWHQKDSAVPVAGSPTRAVFISPRVGVAWDVFGDGRNVFRGGWGMYRSHDSTSVASGALTSAIGLQTYKTTGTYSCSYKQLFTTQAATRCGAFNSTSSGSVAAFEVYGMDRKDDEMPLTYNYNFTMDQQLRWGMTAEVAYVGSQSNHLSTLGNLQNQNVIPLGGVFGPDPAAGASGYGITSPAYSIPTIDDYRPYPNYDDIMVANHTLWSNYNALQVSLNRQKGAFIFGVNYTWSKAMGVRGNYDSGYIADPVNPHHDYGLLAFDRPHVLNATFSWQEGERFRGAKLLRHVLNDWEISGITSLQSGADLAVLNGSTNYNMSAGVSLTEGSTTYTTAANGQTVLGSPDYTLQPVATCDTRLNLHNSTVSGVTAHEFVNGSCLALPTLGSQGWWTLPDTRGPKYFKADLSLYKDFKVRDGQNMQFQFSAFNFLNHPLTSFNDQNLNELDLIFTQQGTATDFSKAYASMTAPTGTSFGYTSYKVGQRIVELGFKYNF